MRYALVVAALAVMMSPVLAHAADCAADPNAAIKHLQAEYKKVKKTVSPENQKAYTKALNKAKMAAKTKQNDVACASVAEAEALIAPKK